MDSVSETWLGTLCQPKKLILKPGRLLVLPLLLEVIIYLTFPFSHVWAAHWRVKAPETLQSCFLFSLLVHQDIVESEIHAILPRSEMKNAFIIFPITSPSLALFVYLMVLGQ